MPPTLKHPNYPNSPITLFKTKHQASWKSKLSSLAALAALIVIPALLQSTPQAYLIRSAGLVGLYVLLALGLNFTLGYAGLFDLGYIAFYAIGAYTAAKLAILGWSFPVVVAASIAAALIVRLWVGVAILRLRGDYLAIVTMGFGEITRLVLNNWDSFTNGPKGLPRVGETIMPIRIFGFSLISNLHYYYLILIFIVAAVIISKRLENSRLGRAWVAIREDEMAAQLTGIPVANLKLAAFMISAVFAAVAGSLFAYWERFVTPESFVFWESILIVAMIVTGGMGSVHGVILGAILLGGAPQILQIALGGSEWINYRYFFFGLVLVLTVLFRPQGLFPEKRRHATLKING
ncbi:MAG: branched-chain amino acid ABC transporter permease [Elusimicrobia bacterium]|nr:branched-chain amino acid ABC transporter permease [Elusimicrobiota bacterium]